MNIMSDLETYLNRATAAKGSDERLAAIMTDMERKYEIPRLAIWLPDWEKKTPNASRILKAYRHISEMRSL